MERFFRNMIMAAAFCTALTAWGYSYAQQIPAPDPPSATSPSTKQPDIDWGSLTDYFVISDARFDKKKIRNSFGWITEFRVVAFLVEAKVSFLHSLFWVNYYDADGIDLQSTGLVYFEPTPISWSPGYRSRAHIILPADMSRVASVKISQGL